MNYATEQQVLARTLRKEHGLSLRKTADAIGVEPSTVYRWEQAEAPIPDEGEEPRPELAAWTDAQLRDELQRRVLARKRKRMEESARRRAERSQKRWSDRRPAIRLISKLREKACELYRIQPCELRMKKHRPVVVARQLVMLAAREAGVPFGHRAHDQPAPRHGDPRVRAGPAPRRRRPSGGDDDGAPP